MVFVCIPVHNRFPQTMCCLRSIKAQTFADYKIIVCDDGSTDGTAGLLASAFPETIIIKGNGNLWWTGAINKCVELVLKKGLETDFVFTLNNDTELLPDTLKNLVNVASKLPNSIVGCLNVFIGEPDRVEPSAFKKTNKYFLKQMHRRIHLWGEQIVSSSEVLEVDSLSGKGILIPIKVFKTIGLYNARDLPHYHADTELIFRAKRYGYKIYLSNVKILSHQNFSGVGTITSRPDLTEFIKSFRSIKSANHYHSLKSYCGLLYGETCRVYLIAHLIMIMLGFSKRYLKSICRSLPF